MVEPIGHQAHHVFPQSPNQSPLRSFFDAVLDFNANHGPVYGWWWEKVSHQLYRYEYHAKWAAFIGGRPASPSFASDVLIQGRLIIADYGLGTLY